MSFTVQDLEQLQVEHPDYRMELEDGKIIIMGQSDFFSEEVIA